VRIALVILHADPSRGGAERYTLQLADSLKGLRHAADVLDADRLGVRGRTRTGRYFDFCKRLRRHLSGGDYDVVHAMLPVPSGCCDVYHPHAGIEAAGVGRWTWLTNPRRAAMARMERRLLGSAVPPVTITLSNYVGGMLRRLHPSVSEARVERIFNAVDLQRFGPSGGRVDLGPPPVALFVGNDFARKGLDLVLRALARSSSWHLAVAGEDRSAGDHFRRMAEREGVADRVRWLGKRDDPDVLYRSADVLVHASRHDPCSLATLEAIATGLLVIGGAYDGAMEAIEPGVHGHVIPVDERAPDQMATHLQSLLDDQVRRRMAEACLTLRPSLAWENHVTRVVALYEAVGSARERPRNAKVR
jgi:UDP-glucose:(heptosyl)LPS alpha-1,3-glucosyltransferase